MATGETALVVVVPEAEPAVAVHRAELDAAAANGVPAHVTVVFPFLPPERLDDATVDDVAGIVATVHAFDLTLARVGWFADRVAWLAPEPAEPFRTLTLALWRRFPEAPPYGGLYPDVVPHLTIGHDAPLERLTAAADDVAASLPITARIEAVTLIARGGPTEQWRTRRELPLSPPRPTGSATASAPRR
jgi:2'-5' RNA ligase